jgi:hypothetical protein
MALQLGKPKMPASKPRKDEERETRQAVIEDARPRARIAISFTATAARWASGDPGI